MLVKGKMFVFELYSQIYRFDFWLFQVSALDVSSGGLGVSAGDDGSSLFVWETSKGVVRVSSESF